MTKKQTGNQQRRYWKRIRNKYEQSIIDDIGRWPEVVDHCSHLREGRRWPEWETAFLAHDWVINPNRYFFYDPFTNFEYSHMEQIAIRYAQQIVKGRWKELEVVCLQQAKQFMNLRFATIYANTIYATYEPEADWSKFAELLLTLPPSEDLYKAFACYADRNKKGIWPEAEQRILTDPQDDLTRDAICWYAEWALKGEWVEAEHLLKDSTCHMLRYAKEVTKKQLPEFLHNAMIIATHDEFQEEYIKFIHSLEQ